MEDYDSGSEGELQSYWKDWVGAILSILLCHHVFKANCVSYYSMSNYICYSSLFLKYMKFATDSKT